MLFKVQGDIANSFVTVEDGDATWSSEKVENFRKGIAILFQKPETSVTCESGLIDNDPVEQQKCLDQLASMSTEVLPPLFQTTIEDYLN